jgi:hypothetical protein
MADSNTHRLDLRVGGKYRLGKKIGSGSFGMRDRNNISQYNLTTCANR